MKLQMDTRIERIVLKELRVVSVIIASLLFFSVVGMITPFHVDAFTEGESVIASGNITDFIWSSDGKQVAYVVCPEGQSWGALWVGDWNGNELVNLQLIYSETEAGALDDWQGDWILFRIRHENAAPDEYYGRGELWKIRDNGTDLIQITFTYTNGIKYTENGYYYFRGSVGYGRFIPETDLVYFSAHDGNGWWKAYTCNANGTDQWNRISESTYSFTIGMSPTGNKLVWGSSWYWDQPTTFYSSDVDGTRTIEMKEFSFKTYPLVLADGDTVMYNTPEGNIGAIQVDGTDNRIILDDEYCNYLVNYNPVDGQSFLMRSNRSSDDNNHIYSVDVDGTSIIQLTDGLYNDYDAMFSPDGHNLLYRRLPVNETSYELTITCVGKLIEDLPSASIKMMFVGDSPGNNISATITIGVYSNGNRLGIGFHQEMIITSVEPGFTPAVGLGYSELSEHSFFTTYDGHGTSDTIDFDTVSRRSYVAWTESQWFGTWNGPLSEQNITDAILWGDIIQFEDLTVYFEDGSTFVCSSHLITLSATFTKTGDLWETNIIITSSDSEGITIDNSVVTISISYPVYVSPIFMFTLITITAAIGIVAVTIYLKSKIDEPEYPDEYVVY